jgi:hypothetical protein
MRILSQHCRLMTIALILRVQKMAMRRRRIRAEQAHHECHLAKEWSGGLQSTSQQQFGAPSSESHQRLKPYAQGIETFDRLDESLD